MYAVLDLREEERVINKELEEVLKFATEHHKGQTRIGGAEYITHPIAVKEILESKGFTGDYLYAALLHDVLEDTEATPEEVLELTNEEVLEAVQLLTKEKNYIMEKYIENIKENKIALLVKLADRIHNLISAQDAYKSFQKRYIKETESYYIELAKGTIFEKDMETYLGNLKEIV